MRTMDVWYAHLDEDGLMAAARGVVAETGKGAKDKKNKAAAKAAGRDEKLAQKALKRAEKAREKAHTRDSLQALSKLGELVDGG